MLLAVELDGGFWYQSLSVSQVLVPLSITISYNHLPPPPHTQQPLEGQFLEPLSHTAANSIFSQADIIIQLTNNLTVLCLSDQPHTCHLFQQSIHLPNKQCVLRPSCESSLLLRLSPGHRHQPECGCQTIPGVSSLLLNVTNCTIMKILCV